MVFFAIASPFSLKPKQRDERAPFHCLHLPVPTNERNSTQVTCAAGFSAALRPLWVHKQTTDLMSRSRGCPLCPKSGHRLGSVPPPALGECSHCGLARRRVAMRRRPVLMVSEGKRQHLRRSYGHGDRN